jgi:nicotinate-nucleotide adenylyltransferase
VRPEGGLAAPRRAAGLARLPRHGRGMRIGLLGGTFNPPHAGHRLISLTALARLGLDRVWWLVTPGNPLKDTNGLPPLAERVAASRAAAAHPRIDVTDVEAAIGTRFTHDTIAALKRMAPGVEFVWLMGADNLAGFHRWQRWRRIAGLVPIAVIDRPGSTHRALRSRAGVALAPYRRRARMGRALAGASRPAWLFLHGKRSGLSSTALREKGRMASGE